jgi:polar amino acid transport system substrate-binding protein
MHSSRNPRPTRRELLLVTAASILVSRAARAEGAPSGALAVASEDYPPYAFNRRGHREGFDVAKVQMVLADLRLRAVQYPMLREAMLVTLDDGKMDLAFPFNRTAERAAKYILVGPLHQSNTVLAVSKADAKEPVGMSSLTGRRVGVTLGHTYPAAFEAANDFTRVPCSSYTLAMRRLADGLVDAVIGDRAVMDHLASTEGLQHKIYVSKTSIAKGPSYCLFPKSHAELAAQFEEALHRLEAAGKFKELAESYPTVEVPLT